MRKRRSRHRACNGMKESCVLVLAPIEAGRCAFAALIVTGRSIGTSDCISVCSSDCIGTSAHRNGTGSVPLRCASAGQTPVTKSC